MCAGYLTGKIILGAKSRRCDPLIQLHQHTVAFRLVARGEVFKAVDLTALSMKRFTQTCGP